MKALSAFLLQVLSIASIISAALGFSGTRYVMNRFVLRIPRVLPGSTCYQNSSLSFDLMDMEPLLNETLFTQCMATWDGKLNGYPSDTARAPCRDETYGWYLEPGSLSGPKVHFTLEAQHSFIDPSVGPPPKDWVTTFAHSTFSAPENMTCFLYNSHHYECSLKIGTSNVLAVYAVVAK